MQYESRQWLLKLIPVSRKEKKLDNRKDSASSIVALVILHSQNALYRWEKNPVLLAVGWFRINSVNLATQLTIA
ncbi:hypothetical protein [Okeania sp.]|uniref:hypothetical protein n=1 Tax=Okeania sp. TaxID=3100323 RepID=UPI002B4ABBEB|nr:hypothetical protein [Okeania sp.]